MARRNNNNKKVTGIQNMRGGKTNGSTNISVVTNNSTFDSTYVNNTLSKNAGNLNYSYLPGSRIFKDLFNIDYSNYNGMISLPGVMTFPLYMTIGNQDNLATDPINLAAQQIYTKVRAANSGAKNYDQNNLMVHIMAMQSIYAFHAFLLRIAGLTWAYSSNNYYIPNVIAEALDIDISDFIANSAQFERFINMYAARTSSIVIPDVIPMLTDTAMLINRVFVDEPNDIGQMYVFKPMGFYRYEENVDSGEAFGSLQWEPLYKSKDNSYSKLTFKEVVDYGNALLNDLLYSEDMAIIAGDIKKAYPENTIMSINMTDQFNLEFVYDSDVLVAIQNAQTVPSCLTITPSAITANTTDNNIRQVIYLDPLKTGVPADYYGYINATDKVFINQITNAPELKDNFNAIRFKTLLSFSNSHLVIDAYSLLVLGEPYVTGYDWNNGKLTIKDYPFLQTIAMAAESGATPTSAVNTNHTLISGSSFNCHPFIYSGVAYYDSTDEAKKYPMIKKCYPIGNIYQPTIITREVVDAMNRAYLMSEFGV